MWHFLILFTITFGPTKPGQVSMMLSGHAVGNKIPNNSSLPLPFWRQSHPRETGGFLEKGKFWYSPWRDPAKISGTGREQRGASPVGAWGRTRTLGCHCPECTLLSNTNSQNEDRQNALVKSKMRLWTGLFFFFKENCSWNNVASPVQPQPVLAGLCPVPRAISPVIGTSRRGEKLWQPAGGALWRSRYSQSRSYLRTSRSPGPW